MTHKVILIILDGLAASTAQQCLGHTQALLAAQQGTFYTFSCELPSLSRPLYECILTGVAPIESGIVHNHISRLSKETSIFHLVRQAGKTTAAAAYHWVSELYNRSPFNPAQDRHTSNPNLAIQYGHFYYQDHYPDSHLLDDAEHLRQSHQPDFLLVHTMNIDDAGHRFGYDSPQYRNSTRHADLALASYLQTWLDDGYQIIITADHGMNNDKSHGGTLPEEREVPLILLGDAFSQQPCSNIRQTELCGTIATLMGLTHNKAHQSALLKQQAT